MKLNTSLSKLGLFAIVAVSITLTSCKKLDNLVQVNLALQMAKISFTIQPSPAGTSSNTGVYHYDVDSAIKASNASFGVGNIKSAKIDSVVVTLADSTFAGVTNSRAWFYSDAVTDTVTIAANINSSALSSLTLQPSTTVDLTSYLKATSFTYTFSSTHPLIANPIQANAAVYFHLVVGPN